MIIFPKLTLILFIDAPRYSRGLIIAASCAIAATGVILVLKFLYRLFDNGDDGVEIEYGIAA